MTKPEYSGTRDLTYSRWHRTIGDECIATNIDWVEVRYGKIKAIIEDKDDRSKGIPSWQLRIMNEIATSLGVPLYIVFHNCTYKSETEWQFRVLNFKESHSVIMNRDEYKKFLKSL